MYSVSFNDTEFKIYLNKKATLALVKNYIIVCDKAPTCNVIRDMWKHFQKIEQRGQFKQSMKKGLITIILFNFCEEKVNVCQGMYVANILNLTSVYSTNTTASISLLKVVCDFYWPVMNYYKNILSTFQF